MAARARELLKVSSDGGKAGSIQNPSPPRLSEGGGGRALARSGGRGERTRAGRRAGVTQQGRESQSSRAMLSGRLSRG